MLFTKILQNEMQTSVEYICNQTWRQNLYFPQRKRNEIAKWKLMHTKRMAYRNSI